METLLGIKGPDFVMLAADTTHARSIIVMKEGKHSHLDSQWRTPSLILGALFLMLHR